MKGDGIMNIEQARRKAWQGERLNFADAMALYEDNDLLFLAECARQAKERQKDVGRCVKSPKWLQRLEEGVSKRSRASEGVKHQRKPTQAHG